MAKTIISTFVLLGLLASSGARADSAPKLPDDQRLGSSRSDLEALLTGLASQGLPAELVVVKVREGLAKNVPVARILVVARQLGAELKDLSALAHAALGLRGADRPPPGLLKAMADARASGASKDDVSTMLTKVAPRGAKAAERAAETLADLAARGYPTGAAAGLVATIAARKDAGKSLSKLVRALEAFRKAEGLSHADALAAVRDAVAGGASPDAAIKKASSAAATGKALGVGKGQKPSKPIKPQK